MNYGNRIRYDEVDRTIDFYIKDQELAEKFMEVIENMAHEAISVNNYERTLDLVSMLVDCEKEMERFQKPKVKPTYPATSSGLLEDE